ncbi:hypothetical protein [Mesorhizobium abyssinicae]|uniref:hypothetical protein n=1 Tax=Mesorhizobium abyssinicae TaxID=1209958 RepID=UPI003399B34F
MADSDNITTLSVVTRKTGTVLSASAIEQAPAETGIPTEPGSSDDPAVAVWRKWQTAQEETERLNREQQRLERKLVETVGFPSAIIQLSDGSAVTLHSLEALRDLIDAGSVDVAAVVQAEVDLAAHNACWEVADRTIGYSVAIRAEDDAADRALALLEALSETQAVSLAGVAAKLDAVLREGQPSKDDGEFPWPQIRSVLEDIGRIGGQTASG